MKKKILILSVLIVLLGVTSVLGVRRLRRVYADAGDQAAAQGDFEQALALWSRATTLGADNIDLLAKKARAHAALKDADAAGKALQKLLAHAPALKETILRDDVFLNVNQGSLFQQLFYGPSLTHELERTFQGLHPRTRLTQPGAKILLIGLDGVDLERFQPMLDAGALPNLARLIEHGASGILDSTILPVSSAAWSTALTGRGPGKTGVMTFVNRLDGSYELSPVSSKSRHGAALWELVEPDQAVAMIAFPLTYPVEPLNGLMLSDWLTPEKRYDHSPNRTSFPIFSYPAEFTTPLRALTYDPELSEQNPLAWNEHQIQLTGRIVEYLLAHHSWDLFGFYFPHIDSYSHRFWSNRPLIERTFRLIDAQIGRAVQAAGPDAHIVVMSDHGFRHYDHVFDVQKWLIERGYATPLRENAPSAPTDAAPTAATDPALRQKLEGYVRLKVNPLRALDWSATRAYCFEMTGEYAAIRWNLKGREPEGIVPPEESDALREAITRDLKSLRDDAGRPVVGTVYTREELYQGPFAARMPDLVFSTINGHVPAFSGKPILNSHRREGMVIVSGPAVRRGTALHGWIGDITPTLLYLLDLPIPTAMDGRVLSEAFTPEFQAAHPIRTIDKDLQIDTDRAEGDVDPALEEKLRALGYVQ